VAYHERGADQGGGVLKRLSRNVDDDSPVASIGDQTKPVSIDEIIRAKSDRIGAQPDRPTRDVYSGTPI
jgi:hypothetical protein